MMNQQLQTEGGEIDHLIWDVINNDRAPFNNSTVRPSTCSHIPHISSHTPPPSPRPPWHPWAESLILVSWWWKPRCCLPFFPPPPLSTSPPPSWGGSGHPSPSQCWRRRQTVRSTTMVLESRWITHFPWIVVVMVVVVVVVNMVVVMVVRLTTTVLESRWLIFPFWWWWCSVVVVMVIELWLFEARYNQNS